MWLWGISDHKKMLSHVVPRLKDLKASAEGEEQEKALNTVHREAEKVFFETLLWVLYLQHSARQQVFNGFCS